MTINEVLAKVQRNEGMTVKEINIYQEAVKPTVQVYGKYGTLAKQHLEEHNPAKLWALMGNLPEYLHGIDRQADEIYETLYAKLSESEQYRKTGDFLKDLQIETEIKQIIEEESLNELVYVD